MKTRTSWFAVFLIVIGFCVFFLSFGNGEMVGAGFGMLFLIFGKLIQQSRNIESYLEFIAKNSNPVISDYPKKRYKEKPIEALKAAVKHSATPKDDDDDASKYAPK